MQLSNAIVPIEEVTERLGYKTWEQALVRDLNVMQKNKARPFDFDMLNEFNEVMDPPPKRGDLLSRILAGDWGNYCKGWIMALDGAVNYAQAHTKREGAFHVSSRYFRVDEHDPPLDIYLMPSTAISSDDLEGLAKIVPAETSPHHPDQVTVRGILKNDQAAAARDGFVCLSTNPLGLYSTWMKRAQLDRLIELQVGDNSWVQNLPTHTQADEFDEKLKTLVDEALILSKGADNTLVQHRSGIVVNMKEIPTSTSSAVTLRNGRKGRKTVRTGRMQTKTVMGKSANEVLLTVELPLGCPMIVTYVFLLFFSGQTVRSNGKALSQKKSKLRYDLTPHCSCLMLISASRLTSSGSTEFLITVSNRCLTVQSIWCVI